MTRWYLDTEFNEDGRTIDLISIALVAEDDREYYAVPSAFDESRCNDFVRANVLPHLPAERKDRATIAADVRELLLADGKPEIWAYFADYDWVVLCQLYGPMVSLPKGFPYWCRDLKQEMARLGVEKSALPQQESAEHDALNDARWVRCAFRAMGLG